MRRIVWSLAILANAGPLRAGVYNLDGPRKYPDDYTQVTNLGVVRQVMIHLAELRAIDDRTVNPQFPAAPDSLRIAYAKQAADLEEKRRTDTLSPMDRVNLGACLIRLGRFSSAQALLNESLRVVPPDSPERFLLLLNQASAFQEDDDQLQRAIDTQRQALRAWPALWPGWNRWENSWYHHAETFALQIMQERQKELLSSRGRPSAELPRYYDLFPKVRFVSPNGEYEAGGIAFAEFNQLPADAEMLVLQLLLWRPLDNRLYWLYGELLNVRGQVDWAFEVLNYLDKAGWANRELRRHLRVLREAMPVYEKLFTDPSGLGENRRLQAAILWSLTPRGATLGAGVGPAFSELGGAATVSEDQQVEPATSPVGVLPDWRHVTVGFVAGVVVAVLGALQLRQWRRSRPADG
jgi:tetratricopeptide (TPR) repeat protein